MLRVIQNFVGILLIFFLTGLITFEKVGIIALILLIISIAGILFTKENIPLAVFEKLILISFALYSIIIGLNIFYFDGNIREFDTPSRFILLIPIFFFLKRLDFSFSYIKYGIILFSIFNGLNIILSSVFFDLRYMESNGLIGSLIFDLTKHEGIATFYFGIMGIASIFFISKVKSKASNFLYLISGIIALISMFLLGGRGVWLSSIITFLFLIFVNKNQWDRRCKFLAMFTFFFAIIVSNILSDIFTSRLNKTYQEFNEYTSQEFNQGSVSDRLIQWKGSLMVIKKNLIFGIGENNWKTEKDKLINQGLIEDNYPMRSYNHVHNEYLNALLEQGIVGLISLLAIFTLPLIYGMRNVNNSITNDARLFLIVLVCMYSTYGLSNGVFDHQSTAIYYALMVLSTMATMKLPSKSL